MPTKKERKDGEKRVLEYLRKVEKQCPTLTTQGRNLTRLYIEGKLDEIYGRDTIVSNIQKILLRKSKANVLLTGDAGCGKTAIAERTAAMLAERTIALAIERNRADAEYARAVREWENDGDDTTPYPKKITIDDTPLDTIVLFELSLSSFIAGAKYVGQAEERVKTLLEELAKVPQVVLFIDEIHTLMGLGQGEFTPSVSQYLKPALARRDMRVIGATTTEEAERIFKDKAMARRFNEIKVEPLRGAVALETATKILTDYAKYHEIAVDVAHTAEILGKLDTFLPKSVFPDNFINVVDEALVSTKFDGLTAVDMTYYNAVIGRMAGVVIV